MNDKIETIVIGNNSQSSTNGRIIIGDDINEMTDKNGNDVIIFDDRLIIGKQLFGHESQLFNMLKQIMDDPNGCELVWPKLQ